MSEQEFKDRLAKMHTYDQSWGKATWQLVQNGGAMYSHSAAPIEQLVPTWPMAASAIMLDGKPYGVICSLGKQLIALPVEMGPGFLQHASTTNDFSYSMFSHRQRSYNGEHLRVHHYELPRFKTIKEMYAWAEQQYNEGNLYVFSATVPLELR